MPTAYETLDGRVSIREGFLWDAQDAYLFDIDGTLLRSRDRIHFNSFASSVHQVTGLEISLTGVSLSGSRTQGFCLMPLPSRAYPPTHGSRSLDAILQAMRQTSAGRRSEMELWTMPGVEETLGHLAAQRRAAGPGDG